MTITTHAPARRSAVSARGRKSPIRLSVLFATVLFFILALIFLLPFYWMIISSFKPTQDVFSTGFNLIPERVQIDGYTGLLATEYPRWFLNSIVQSSIYAVVTVAICALSGFALAKYRFRFRNALFVVILVVQMVPFHLLIVPLFVMISNTKLIDTYWAALLPLMAHPIGLFFMRQYMLALEDEMLDSARVDGANEYQMFLRIVVPNIKPAIATLLVLFALEYWNNLLWPLIAFRSASNFPLAVGISTMNNLNTGSTGRS